MELNVLANEIKAINESLQQSAAKAINKHLKRYFSVLPVALLMAVGACTVKPAFVVEHLLTDNMVNPLGLDEVPVFSWSIRSNIVGAAQTAYQIVITEKNGREVWNTGKVLSGQSANVELDYAMASNLKNATDYFWTVTVWDQDGQEHKTSRQRFSTGLAYELCTSNSEDFDNVKDAVFGPEATFIGSPFVTLDADALTIYRMGYDFEIMEGGTQAGFVFGANDLKLNNALYNDFLIEGENWIDFVVDIKPLLDGTGAAQAMVLRKGYGPQDYEQPDDTSVLGSYDLKNITRENMYAKHSVSLLCDGGRISGAIDGVPFIPALEASGGSMGGFPGFGFGGSAFNRDPKDTPKGGKKGTNVSADGMGYLGEYLMMMGGSSQALTLNPTGKTGDACKYPRLNDIGFSAKGTATFSNVYVKYYNQPSSVVFGEQTGATYDIFKGKEGVRVEGSQIKVTDTMAYADPSFGSEPMVRTAFTTTGKIANAKLYVTSRGVNQFFINGKMVESDVAYFTDASGKQYHRDYLSPGMLHFYGTMRYVTYDVTDMLSSDGANAMGAVMGPGWWGDEYVYDTKYFNWYGEQWGVLAKLVIQYQDGTTQEIVTNEKDWKSYLGGPITYSSLYHGEYYDATKEASIEGWSTASYDDSQWTRAAYTPTAHANFDNPDYEGRVDYPVHVVEVREGVLLNKPAYQFGDNPQRLSYVFDMGENMVGVPEITFGTALPKGTEVILRYGETMVKGDFVYPENAKEMDGMIYTENYRGARSLDRYIAKGGEAPEVFSPSFTFHGWRYLDVSINSDSLSLSEQEAILSGMKVKGLVLSSIGKITASFQSSNALLDRFFLNVARSHLGNHVSVGTDCPQRNERLPFLGDQQIYSETSVFMADMAQFYSNYAQIAHDNQLNNPSRDYVAAATGRGTYFKKEGVPYDPQAKSSNVAWPVGGLTMAWDVYANNGDLSIIREHYPAFVQYTRQFINAGEQDPYFNYLFNGSGLSNHLEMSKSSNSGYDQNCEFGRVLTYMATMADALGYKEDAAYYKDYFEKLKEEFNKYFISSEDIPLDYNGNPTTAQSSYAIALYYDMVDTQMHPDFVRNFIERCQNEGTELTSTVNGVELPLHEYSITTGFTGTPCVLGALMKYGAFDTAYKMLENTRYTSWLYPVTIGATSLWERWNSETEIGPNKETMNSWNHYGFGVAAHFMITSTGGICRGENGLYANVGFQDFILQPVAGGSLDHASVSYDSSYGLIKSAWTANPNVKTEKGTSDMLSYKATVPANTRATLFLPLGKTFTKEAAEKFQDIPGVAIKGIQTRNGIEVAVFALSSGAYVFTGDGNTLSASLQKGYFSKEDLTED